MTMLLSPPASYPPSHHEGAQKGVLKFTPASPTLTPSFLDSGWVETAPPPYYLPPVQLLLKFTVAKPGIRKTPATGKILH